MSFQLTIVILVPSEQLKKKKKKSQSLPYKINRFLTNFIQQNWKMFSQSNLCILSCTPQYP